MKKTFFILFVLIVHSGMSQGLFSSYVDIKDNRVQCNPPEIIKQKKIKAINIWKIFIEDSTKVLLKSTTYYNNNGEIVLNGSCMDSISNDTIKYIRCDDKLIIYTLKQYDNRKPLKSLTICVDKETGKIDTSLITSYHYFKKTVVKKDSSKNQTIEFTYNSKGSLINRKQHATNGIVINVEEMSYNRKGYLKKMIVSGSYPRKVVIKYKNKFRKKTTFSYSYRGSLHAIQQHIYDKKGRLIEESRGNPKNETTYQKLVYFYSNEGLLDHVDEIQVKNGKAAIRYVFEYEYF